MKQKEVDLFYLRNKWWLEERVHNRAISQTPPPDKIDRYHIFEEITSERLLDRVARVLLDEFVYKFNRLPTTSDPIKLTAYEPCAPRIGKIKLIGWFSYE